MDIYRAGKSPCPASLIAIAIHPEQTHTGLVFESEAGSVEMCDLEGDKKLSHRPVPPVYFWTQVQLRPAEVDAIAAFVELVLARHRNEKPLPYSFRYTPDAFDVTGKIRDSAGLTCVTFIVAIFERLKLPLVNVSTWPSRPNEDAAFRMQFLEGAIRTNTDLATRLLGEGDPDFRIKPIEIFAAAGGGNYPVKFSRAKTLATRASAVIKKKIAAEGRP